MKEVVEAVEDPVQPVKSVGCPQAKSASRGWLRIQEPKSTDALGRISAQTAKQVILQKVREAERDSVFSEFRAAMANWSIA